MTRRTGILGSAAIIALVVVGLVVSFVVRTQSPSHNGPGSYLGHASNAVIFVQWTRTGNNLSGSLDEATTKSPAGSGVSSDDQSFTGVIEGTGLTVTSQNGKGLVGQFVSGNDFTLGIPGNRGGLISTNFSPADVGAYNHAVKRLDLEEYSSPCVLYVQEHNATIVITGADDRADCANFVQKNPLTRWTTEKQDTSDDSPEPVCALTNPNGDEAAVLDTGLREYGREACRSLAREGWTEQ